MLAIEDDNMNCCKQRSINTFAKANIFVSKAWLQPAVTRLTFALNKTACHIILHNETMAAAHRAVLVNKEWVHYIVRKLETELYLYTFSRCKFRTFHDRRRPHAVLQRRHACLSNSCWGKLRIFASLFHETRSCVTTSNVIIDR